MGHGVIGAHLSTAQLQGLFPVFGVSRLGPPKSRVDRRQSDQPKLKTQATPTNTCVVAVRQPHLRLRYTEASPDVFVVHQ